MYLQTSFWVSERRACRVFPFARSVHRYRSVRKDQVVLRQRIRDIAAVRVRYGYRRIHILLRREGFAVNHKRVHRIYCEEGLNLRRKRPRRHVTAARRVEKPKSRNANESWSMDFVSDALFDGRRFRALTLVNNFSRECLAIRADQRLQGEDVATILDQVAAARSSSRRLWTSGRTNPGSPWTSLGRESRRITHTSSRSTEASAMSV